MAKKLGLGKGVGALIQSAATAKKMQDGARSSNKYEVVEIDIEKIVVNPLQPRKEFDPIKLEELKDSILKYGLLNPISVKEIIGGFEIIAGERRFRAFQLAGLPTVPAIITSISSNAEQLEKALIENIQREDLNPLEIAHSYQQLIEEFDYTQEQLAERVGKERSTVANFIRLLKLPDSIQGLLLDKKITMGHARALLSLDEHLQMITAANEILDKELSVRATESLVKNILSEKIVVSKEGNKKNTENKQTRITTEEQMMLQEIQGRLREKLGTNVKIFTKQNYSGSIEIEFYSNDDFERIVEMIENIE